MTDIVLNNITSGYNISKVNANFTKIQDSINNDVLNLAGGNNTMGQGIDMNSSHVYNMADAVASLDAVNLRQVLGIISDSLAGVGSGGPGFTVDPMLFTWVGDGVTTDFALNGADVESALFYDVGIDGVLQEPYVDYTVVRGGSGIYIRFPVAPTNGSVGWAVLRGYAKPYSGDTPITTVAGDITVITGDTTIDNTAQNALLVVTANTDTTITIKVNTGSIHDWKVGEYFSVMQLGTGKVTIAIEGGGTLYPSAGFLTETRDQNCIISATVMYPDSNSWAVSGDLLAASLSPDIHIYPIRCYDVSGTELATGVGVGYMRASYDFALLGIRATVQAAQSGGATFTVDVLVNGTSVLSTLVTIDNGKFSSISSVNQPVISSPFILDDDLIRVDITQVGTSSATNLIVSLLGQRTS